MATAVAPPLPAATRSGGSRRVGPTTVAIFMWMLVFVVGFLGFRGCFSRGDWILNDHEYALAYTYLAKVDVDGSVVPGEVVDERDADVRILDFAVRDQPRPSVMAPLTDGYLRFVKVVKEGQTPGTAKRVHVKVSPVIVEGMVYHRGYEFNRWEICFSHSERQSHFPSMIPAAEK